MQAMDFPTLDFGRVSFNTDGFLFYPCAGTDLVLPLTLFQPYIDFHLFADKAYFHPRRTGLMQAAPVCQHQSLAPLFDQAELIHASMEGEYIESHGHDITPCTYTERYQTGERLFDIDRRRGYGVSALRIAVPHISVFFYRGDSEGEGGSGNPWLSARLFVKVLARMHDQGLIVTDGSQTCGSKQYTPFARFHRQSPTTEQVAEYLSSKPQFQDHWGNRFECLGYVGMRYGPTLVWKYHQSAAFKTVIDEIEASLQKEYVLAHQDRKSQVGRLARKLRKHAKKVNICHDLGKENNASNDAS